MFSELIRYTKKMAMRMLLFPLRVFSVKNNRVLLINDLAYNYSDNPKYIAEYLLKSDTKFQIFFSVSDPSKYEWLIEKGIIPIRFNSWQYFYYGMTSKVIVTNSGGISYLPIRKTQYVINTWHGGGAYKKMGIDMYEDTNLFRKDLLLAAKMTNIVLVTTERFKNVFCESMLTPSEKAWMIGMPRNDMLINPSVKEIQRIRSVLGLKTNQKLVLFAPTYRKTDDNYFKDSVAISYGIDENMVCKSLKERFGGDWVFSYRYHPCAKISDEHEQKSSVINLTNYEDMQELLLVADVLINDFSSSMWDFMLTKKPCFIFAVDLQHYIDTTSVYTPVSEWPFSKAITNDELRNNILNFNEKEYFEKCDEHYRLLGGCETGIATQLTCSRIEDKCLHLI